MTSAVFDVGDLVRIVANFTINGVPSDPTSIAVRILSPSGAESTPTASKDSAGAYHVDVNANAPGNWFYRITSTGTAQAAAEGSFTVRASRFANP